MSVITPDQVIQTVYNSIAKSVIQSMQNAQSQVFSSQEIIMNCGDTAVAEMTSNVKKCIKTLKLRGKNNTSILKLCKPVIQCNATNVSMKSSLNVTDLINQTASIQSNISNSTSDKLSQSLSSLDQSLLLSQTDKTLINNITDIVSENSSDITQVVYDSVLQQQGLTLDNYAANNITEESITDVVISKIQTLDGIQSLVTKISNSVVQKLSSNTDSLTSWVTTISLSALGFIIVLFFIIYTLKRNDTREFAVMILPYLIFVIGVSIIIGVHLLFKPKYILIDDHKKSKIISRGKFIFWVSFFSILLGAIEIIYYKIIKKRNSNNT